MIVWHWFAHLMGWDSVVDNQYAFSSGSGFILLVWLGSVFLYLRRTSCKAEWWCPFHGAHDFTDPQTGVTHRLCWIHHPHVKKRHVTLARLREYRRTVNQSEPERG